MLITKVLICVSFIFGCDAYANRCSTDADCTLFRSCPEAIRFAAINQSNDEKLKTSLCGTEIIDGKRLPKVCCSAFRMTDDRSGFFGDDSEGPGADSLETHPNINLLPTKCGQIDGDRIFGGVIANLWEFPWMALISHRTRAAPGKDNLQFKCGGSIINSRYVITAAHCVVNKKLAGVRVGEFDINSKEDCQGEYPKIYCERHIQDISIEESIPHQGYERSPVDNDIALLRLKKPIDFAHKNVAPICLPVKSDLRNVVLGGKSATVAGWGTTDTGYQSSVLRKVTIPILTASACRDIYNKNSDSGDTTLKKICAGELKKDSCSGDSGGPLMLESQIDGKFRMIQYGVVSYGPKQCGSLFPGVYTDVTAYIDWILDTIKA
ncbi:CLIP domain-containing serine protease HP8 [Vanessa tameamea]|uniref:CLIP domain-containing serine protease HP8 n=1 Tax=Vanessa tameamea TaxID=334116 RepID=A0A8B8HZG9_VANTA|nr:CLIP domain-containing serine protease 2 isoform X1 [Vanessa tameamea]